MPKARTFGRTHLALCLALAAGVAAIGVSAVADATAARPGDPRPVVIRDTSGVAVGRLSILREGFGTARVSVSVKGLTPGFHGFHIHTTGLCDPKAVDPATGQVSPFFTAGGHLDLAGGAVHPGHSGDLPPLLVGKDGSGSASVVTDRFGLRELTDADGSAVIVHALPDNLANIPARYAPDGPDEATHRTGDAGGRTACGVIR
ncbi:superoxide dismutase family protein [Nonomuraea sp. NPDC001831]|uniref:superoxide dismutase family protein n=1 Tax=Nonomuraea sp. NPDC001831 TaxID=3364340 RepID=UPI003685FE8D